MNKCGGLHQNKQMIKTIKYNSNAENKIKYTY